MTHSDLPNSIFLEESWFGYPVTSALSDNVYWDLDRIIAGGGWGMRLLKAKVFYQRLQIKSKKSYLEMKSWKSVILLPVVKLLKETFLSCCGVDIEKA